MDELLIALTSSLDERWHFSFTTFPTETPRAEQYAASSGNSLPLFVVFQTTQLHRVTNTEYLQEYEF